MNDSFNARGLRLASPIPGCDFDEDGQCSVEDLDQLFRDGESDLSATDLTGDGVVDNLDRDEWLRLAGQDKGQGPFLVGDSNLDGVVDKIDLNAVGVHWMNPDALSWSEGNFSISANQPGVNSVDLNELAVNWMEFTEAVPAAVVPESKFGMTQVLVLGLFSVALYRRRNV